MRVPPSLCPTWLPSTQSTRSLGTHITVAPTPTSPTPVWKVAGNWQTVGFGLNEENRKRRPYSLLPTPSLDFIHIGLRYSVSPLPLFIMTTLPLPPLVPLRGTLPQISRHPSQTFRQPWCNKAIRIADFPFFLNTHRIIVVHEISLSFFFFLCLAEVVSRKLSQLTCLNLPSIVEFHNPTLFSIQSIPWKQPIFLTEFTPVFQLHELFGNYWKPALPCIARNQKDLYA